MSVLKRIQEAMRRFGKQPEADADADAGVERDLEASRSINIDSVETVCLALGPYRNLTTLTAATLFLHPNCQVLNHASDRIFGVEEIDFLPDFSRQKLDRFTQFAIRISAKGKQGDYGGSITYSHAFDAAHNMQELHESTDSGLLKENINSLFWKESLRTSNLIRQKGIDLTDIFDKDERLRFLLPIRNPMDCAISNLKTGHVQYFEDLDENPSPTDVLKEILDEIRWFATLQKKNPERFFYFFEHDISSQMLTRLAEFLHLDADERWIANALAAMKIKSGYDHDRELVDFYRNTVNVNFKEFPQLSEGLLRFIDNSDHAHSDH